MMIDISYNQGNLSVDRPEFSQALSGLRTLKTAWPLLSSYEIVRQQGTAHKLEANLLDGRKWLQDLEISGSSLAVRMKFNIIHFFTVEEIQAQREPRRHLIDLAVRFDTDSIVFVWTS